MFDITITITMMHNRKCQYSKRWCLSSIIILSAVLSLSLSCFLIFIIINCHYIMIRILENNHHCYISVYVRQSAFIIPSVVRTFENRNHRGISYSSLWLGEISYQYSFVNCSVLSVNNRFIAIVESNAIVTIWYHRHRHYAV